MDEVFSCVDALKAMAGNDRLRYFNHFATASFGTRSTCIPGSYTNKCIKIKKREEKDTQRGQVKYVMLSDIIKSRRTLLSTINIRIHIHTKTREKRTDEERRIHATRTWGDKKKKKNFVAKPQELFFPSNGLESTLRSTGNDLAGQYIGGRDRLILSDHGLDLRTRREELEVRTK